MSLNRINVPMPSNHRPEHREFARKAFIAVLIGLGCILFALFIGFAIHYILLIFMAVLFSTLIRGTSGYIKRALRIPDSLSVLAVILAVAGVALLLYKLLFPQIAAQASEMGSKLSEALPRLYSIIKSGPAGKFLEKAPDLNALLGSNTLEGAKAFLSSLSGVVIDLVVIFFITVYMSFEPEAYIHGLFSLFPKKKRDNIVDLFNSMGSALRRWLVGTILEMAVVGTLSAIGLHLIGVPLAMSLGILAMLLTFIPYLGAIISAIPAILIALLSSPVLALYVVLLYLFIHAVDAYLMYPLIQRHQMRLPPGLIIAAQVLLGYFTGIMGVMAATPLTALIVEFIKKVYIEDVLKGKTASDGVSTP